MSLIYCVFFGFLEGLAETFSGWHFNAGKVGLTFLALCIGLAFSLLPLPWIYSRYVRREKEAQAQLAEIKAKGVPDNEISPLAGQPPPEERLVHAMLGTWFMVAGLFWQGWTSILAPHGSPWPAIAALVFVGMGVLAWFISSYRTSPLVRLMWKANCRTLIKSTSSMFMARVVLAPSLHLLWSAILSRGVLQCSAVRTSPHI